MAVYGDLYMLLNALCDLLLLTLCSAVLRRPVKKRRLFLGAAIGGLYALLSLFLPRLPAILCSFPAAFLMVLAAFSFGTPKRFFFTFTVCYLCSFFLSGAVSFFSDLLDHCLPAPFAGLTLLALLFFSCLAALFFVEVLKRRPAYFCARLRFTCGKRVYECTALCDSGNLLYDDALGLPVILLSPALFKDLPPPGRTIAVHSVCSGEDLPLVELCGVSIDGIPAEACAAVCRSARPFTHHDALLPAALIPHRSDRKKGSLRFHFSKK